MGAQSGSQQGFRAAQLRRFRLPQVQALSLGLGLRIPLPQPRLLPAILSTLDARTLSLAHLTPARFAGEASPPQRGERSCVNSAGQRVGRFRGDVYAPARARSLPVARCPSLRPAPSRRSRQVLPTERHSSLRGARPADAGQCALRRQPAQREGFFGGARSARRGTVSHRRGRELFRQPRGARSGVRSVAGQSVCRAACRQYR